MKKDFFSFFKKKSTDGNAENTDSRFDKLSGVISKYFTTEPEKQKVLREENFDAAGDVYYASVCAWYKVLQRVFLALLAVFSIVSVTVNFKHITYDNFFFLIKDFSTAVDTESVNYETLSYDASSDQSFCLYRGGLAVVSRSNVSAFTATGRRTLNNNDTYSKPFAVSSDKYLLVYDMGDGNMALYNSFAKVYSEKLDYPVTAASFSDEGSFAVLTRSEKYESEIIVYNKNFEKLVNFKKGSFAVDISLSDDAERLGAVYCDTDNGIISTKVVFYDIKKHEKLYEYSYTGEFPLACSFLRGGGFAAVTDGAVRIFDKGLVEKSESDGYSGGVVSAVWCDGEYTAVSVNDGISGDRNTLLVFDKKGKLIYNDTVLSYVEQLSLSSGYAFIKNAEGVMRVDLSDSSYEQLESQDGKMLIYDGKTALVCAEAKAVYLKFKD